MEPMQVGLLVGLCVQGLVIVGLPVLVIYGLVRLSKWYNRRHPTPGLAPKQEDEPR